MITMDGVDMVDVREAARLAHRTPETIRRWVWSGRLESRKQGHHLLVPRDAVTRLAGGGNEGSTQREVERPSLQDWVSRALDRRGGKRGSSAADLVQDDRARR